MPFNLSGNERPIVGEFLENKFHISAVVKSGDPLAIRHIHSPVRGPGLVFQCKPLARRRFEFRAAPCISAEVLADLAMRGRAISFLTLAFVAISSLVNFFLRKIDPPWLANRRFAVSFGTLAEYSTHFH
jgi:hypothetical protein